MQDDDRYTRQRRLREIGDTGQERLERANVTIAGGRAAVVELIYLQRAGIGAVAIDGLAEPRPFVHRAVFQHEAARRHAAAAWRALCVLVETARANVPPTRPGGVS